MIWVGGRIVPDDELSIKVLDRTFEHGLGLFETFRTWSGHATLLGRHCARLMRSAGELRLPLAPSALPDAEAVAALLRANGVDGDAMLRITLTGGLSEDCGSTLWMRSAPLPPPLRTAGAVVALDLWEVAPSNPLARYKTLNYWERRRAFDEARRRNADEVLSTGPCTCYWEGSRTNLFVIKNDILITPSLAGPIVPGVMRGLVLEYARDLPLKVSELGRLSPVELRGADEVFLTNSVRGILPVMRAFGSGPGIAPWGWAVPGPWTQRLWIKISDWLHQGGPSRMTTVAEVAKWLDEFAPSRLAEAWDNVGLLWGDPTRRGDPGDDLPDCHAPNRPRGDRRPCRTDRQPSPRALQGGQAHPGRPPRDRHALELGPRGGRDRQPAYGVRQHAWRDQRWLGAPARPGGRGAAPARPRPGVVQGGRFHPRGRSRGGPLGRLRGGGGPDRGL